MVDIPFLDAALSVHDNVAGHEAALAGQGTACANQGRINNINIKCLDRISRGHS